MFYDFICLKCGCKDLDYHKWVYCRDPLIIHPNEHIEYGPAQVDQDQALGMACCYVCRDCGETPLLYGESLHSERDLRE